MSKGGTQRLTKSPEASGQQLRSTKRGSGSGGWTTTPSRQRCRALALPRVLCPVDCWEMQSFFLRVLRDAWFHFLCRRGGVYRGTDLRHSCRGDPGRSPVRGQLRLLLCPGLGSLPARPGQWHHLYPPAEAGVRATRPLASSARSWPLRLTLKPAPRSRK